MEFSLEEYRKYNIDLQYLSDEELQKHYDEIGKYQMRVSCSPEYFSKDIVYIFTTKYGYYIALALKYVLFHNYIRSEIVYNINPLNQNLYIIMFAQLVQYFPKRYILYQLEQKDISNHIDYRYQINILNSLKTWDYSESNINKFSEKVRQKMSYFPIPLIPYKYLLYKPISFQNNENKILFYGSMNGVRKYKLGVLNNLLEPFGYKITIYNKLFGPQLLEEICNSKIVLNIHNYVNGILETNRLNEILSCNKLVISEYPDMNIDFYNYSLYSEKVIFVSTVEEMFEKIVYYLKNDVEYQKKIDTNITKLNEYHIKMIDDVRQFL
jgi:hypothetical protein